MVLPCVLGGNYSKVSLLPRCHVLWLSLGLLHGHGQVCGTMLASSHSLSVGAAPPQDPNWANFTTKDTHSHSNVNTLLLPLQYKSDIKPGDFYHRRYKMSSVGLTCWESKCTFLMCALLCFSRMFSHCQCAPSSRPATPPPRRRTRRRTDTSTSCPVSA